jgi:acyl-[acyl-carrier-protein] desaturase
MEDYTHTLRTREMRLPWDDPLHMLFYTLLQERATQVNYLNLGLATAGDTRSAMLSNSIDPVLAQVCRTIAVDEAAHYHFFLESARLFLYYFPSDAVLAMADVIRHFAMPAGDIIPDYDRFGAALHQAHVFSWRIHHRDVVTVALRQLGAASLRAVEAGIMRSREAPRPDGALQTTAIFDAIDHDHVERSVSRLFTRIEQYSVDSGVEHTVDATFHRARLAVADGSTSVNVATEGVSLNERLAGE